MYSFENKVRNPFFFRILDGVDEFSLLHGIQFEND